MSSKNRLSYQFLLVWVLWSGLVEAEPLLSGIASHQELGREQFLGALYSDVLTTDPEVLFDSRIDKRMELKILASEGMTTRRFSRMWIEGMAINNPTDLLIAQADNMVQFDALFRGRLEANDHVIFSLTSGKGVDVSVNGVLLGNILDDQFFKVLLSSWIGKIPLSSTYRDDLLKMGIVDENFRNRYLHLEPRLSRIAVVRNWNTAVDLTTVDTDSSLVVASPVVEAAIKKPVPLPVIKLAAITLKQKSETEINEKAKPTPIKRPRTAGIEKQKQDETRLTTQVLLAQQFYISAVLNTIHANVSYPRRAQELQQTGNVKLTLVVDEKGNIKDLKPVEESTYTLLNKAAEAAVKTSAPFPPLPDILAHSDLEFFVPIRFSLKQVY